MIISSTTALLLLYSLLNLFGNTQLNLHMENMKVKEEKRTVKKVIKSSISKMGQITMKQPLPHRDLEMIDPFLLLHHHGPEFFAANNSGLPFGPHPHRGFETVTMIYKGDVKHKDSNGFESVIKNGGVQWMTAGKGIVHSERSSEEFKENGGELEIIQLWVNLPADKKMVAPQYEGLQKSDIPSLEFQDGKVTVDLISGKWEETVMKNRGYYPIDLATLTLKANSNLNHHIDQEKNILFYVLEGELEVNGQKAAGHELVLFENSGTELQIAAISDTKILIGAAKPINEPVVSYGPFVMNSEEELRKAIQDYQTGKMGSLEE